MAAQDVTDVTSKSRRSRRLSNNAMLDAISWRTDSVTASDCTRRLIADTSLSPHRSHRSARKNHQHHAAARYWLCVVPTPQEQIRNGPLSRRRVGDNVRRGLSLWPASGDLVCYRWCAKKCRSFDLSVDAVPPLKD